MSDDLVIEDLVIEYGGQTIVHGATLTAPAGKVFGLVGPSGSGKTSILRCVGGYVPPASGSIRVGPHDVTHLSPGARDFGMVFQRYALFPTMTVRRNIAFGLRSRRLAKREVNQRVEEVVELTELGDLLERHPHQLSGGQQQRVALARALAIRPRVLLMDEPLGALDARLRDSLLLGIKKIQSELKITTLYVTHDQREAFMLCDQMAVVNEGRVAAVGAPAELYDHPPTSFVATFVGQGTLLELDVTSLRLDAKVADLPGQLEPLRLLRPLDPKTTRAYVFLRPEAITCRSEDGRGTAGIVQWRRHQGRDAIVGIEVPGHPDVLVGIVGKRERYESERLRISWEPDEAILLEEGPDGQSTADVAQRLVPEKALEAVPQT